ncbi:MAG: hypothetical protein Q9221_001450 [Calogaya cf. arnoldii]
MVCSPIQILHDLGPEDLLDPSDYRLARQKAESFERAVLKELGPAEPDLVETEQHVPMRDGHEHPIRITKPAHPPAGGSPLVICFHGGGFISGTINNVAPYARGLAKLFGAVVFAPTYCLAPEKPFPQGEIQNFSPAAKEKATTLKRKHSELLEAKTPEKPDLFYAWRLSIIDALLDTNNAVLEGHREALLAESDDTMKESHEESIRAVRKSINSLEDEKSLLLRLGNPLKEDIEDSQGSKTIEEAYITEIYLRWRNSSREGQQEMGRKRPERWDRGTFKEKLEKYLEPVDSEQPDRLHCNVTGAFFLRSYVKCAHIVPYAFQSVELDYLFGTDDSALTNVRNGLWMSRGLEGAWGNGKITIIPSSSLDQTPIEWKVVVLDESILGKTFAEDSAHGLWKYHEIDGQTLKFRNSNRPARRYLYFRHAMAHINASVKGWKNWKEKLPSGLIWATPDKSQGYLRRGVLQAIAKKNR